MFKVSYKPVDISGKNALPVEYPKSELYSRFNSLELLSKNLRNC